MTDPNDRPRRRTHRPNRPNSYDILLTEQIEQDRLRAISRAGGCPPGRGTPSRSQGNARGNAGGSGNRQAGRSNPYGGSYPSGKAPSYGKPPSSGGSSPYDRSSPSDRSSYDRSSGGGSGRSGGSRKPGQSGGGGSGNIARVMSLIFLVLLIVSGVILFEHFKDSSAATDATASGNASGSHLPGGDAAADTSQLNFSNDAGKPLSGKLILLDPGHGGHDSGCVYPTSDPTYVESIINLAIAEKTKSALEKLGATVVLLRSDDSWISLYNRISTAHLYCLQYADQMGLDTLSDSDKARIIGELTDTIAVNTDTVDSGGMGIMAGTGVGSDLSLLMNLESGLDDVLYLSIHINSNQYSDLHGTQIYYVTDDSVIKSEDNMIANDSSLSGNPSFPVRDPYYGRSNERNAALAECLYQAITSSAPEMESNAGSTNEDNYAVLREHNLTGALIEVGFITNKADRGYLSDGQVTDKISSGIADGCVNFFSANS
jgi:N-acetylmuramoyl-L-alanine amidase